MMQQKIRTEKSPRRGTLSHKSDETRNINLVNFVPQKSPKSCCLEITKDILKNKIKTCHQKDLWKNLIRTISEIFTFLYF